MNEARQRNISALRLICRAALPRCGCRPPVKTGGHPGERLARCRVTELRYGLVALFRHVARLPCAIARNSGTGATFPDSGTCRTVEEN
jgi:hypothetical protein